MPRAQDTTTRPPMGDAHPGATGRGSSGRALTARDILVQGLRSMGAGGLCCDGCGCGLDFLVACDADPSACEPAIPFTATEEGEYHDAGETIFVPLHRRNGAPHAAP